MYSKIYDAEIKTDYAHAEGFNRYSSDIMAEYKQCIEEGLDIEKYKDLFESVAKMKSGPEKAKMCDTIFEIVMGAKMRSDYKYNEPNEYKKIKKLREDYNFDGEMPDKETFRKKLLGAWTGKACGCLLGKPVEFMKSQELIALLKETGNYPMHRYIMSSDITDEVCSHYKHILKGKTYGDNVECMPFDDDTSYVVLNQKIVEDFGRWFDSEDVGSAWLNYQPVLAYFTAERVAYVNLINCIEPPATAIYKNVCREWVGAQIRGDYFGYINPGEPEDAAKMAYNDASVSHIKNGIYGELFEAAMVSIAAVTDSIDDIILGGIAQIPATSRLYEAVMEIYNGYKNGRTIDEVFELIHSRFDEHTEHGWTHVLPNAMIVTAALLYGEGDFGKSICTAVSMAFDTDSNAASVGSILGMRGGIDCISDEWKKPINGKIQTMIAGVGTVDIEKAVDMTLSHIE